MDDAVVRFAIVVLGSLWPVAGLAEPDRTAPPVEPAAAPPVEPAAPPPINHAGDQVEAGLRPELQLDLGLAVIGLGYEHPVSDHVAIQAELHVFGTYFLPWFDAGDEVAGFGGGVRATWFATPSGRGLYVAPFARVARVTGDLDGLSGRGVAISGGVFVGWAFRMTGKLDLRIGGGAQYLYVDAEPLAASTPLFALDAVVGYRL